MIKVENWQGAEVYKLETNEFSAWVSPAHGSNLYRIKCKKSGVDLLRSPSSPEQLIAEPVMWGTPILFPPNRVRNGSFSVGSEQVQLPINTPEGHHIHGLVLDKSWRFEELSDADGELRLKTSLDFMDFPEILEGYPHHLRFEMELVIQERSLTQAFTIQNRGKSRAATGFGLHTWFNLAGGSNRWTARMQFADIWELGDDFMPTGSLLTIPAMDELRSGVIVGGKHFDTIFRIGENPGAVDFSRDDNISFRYQASNVFKHWVLHTPSDDSSVIAVEPYSWVTNAPNLELDPSLTGFRTLDAGETMSCDVTISLG